MYKYGTASMERLRTCHSFLQAIFLDVLSLQVIDISIVCGYRNKEEQNKAFAEDKSKVKWPHGKHNKYPSEAVDAVPFVNGNLSYNFNHCCFLAGLVIATAKSYPLVLRWGGNWDMDGEPVTDQDFQDLAHYEIVRFL